MGGRRENRPEVTPNKISISLSVIILILLMVEMFRYTFHISSEANSTPQDTGECKEKPPKNNKPEESRKDGIYSRLILRIPGQIHENLTATKNKRI